MSAEGAYLAENLRALRHGRGLTQAQVAKAAGIPRPTLAHVESGMGNPTLQVLVAIAAALQVRIEELLSPPRSQGRLFKASELKTKTRMGVSVRELLPDPLPGVQLERMELPAATRMKGVPHTSGTQEYLTCEAGEVELAIEGVVFELAPGDVVVFRGDQKHSYRNRGSCTAICYSAVLL